ncbi:acetolactate synthase-1/2/3 large subunit [Mesorhizobium shonense]|uniref:Acetolactate synthase-1/2/3 large subunit n=1 Tax=Mesorhizobium shonense TaxID=1209948 RepID=A0ABV2I6M7_9HYPH
MNGAEALVGTLIGGGIDTCFANPGTSEMHLVAALDRANSVRCVLGLFEGVVTGMADGYARIAGKPAATLLHLGPGLGNGVANLHNARKARTPMVNVVGEHATYHRGFNAPLTSDIEGLARPVSDWVETSRSAEELGADTARAIHEATSAPGRIATLIVPADAAWGENGAVARVTPGRGYGKPCTSAIERAAEILRSGARVALLLGGAALLEPALSIAARIAGHTGARLLGPTSAGRASVGAGLPMVERIPYPIALAREVLADVQHLILIGSDEPVAFFAYPRQPSKPLPKDANVHIAVNVAEDIAEGLAVLDELVGSAQAKPRLRPAIEADAPRGDLDLAKLATAVTRLLPENSILVDESITSSFVLLPRLREAAPHDFLQLTGGAIGIGLPLATGAAVAGPSRRVVCMQADGSGMYTPQALWTQAREKLDVVTVVLANRAYATLRGEFKSVGIDNPGPNALTMLDLANPELRWAELAQSMGVEARRVTTAEDLSSTFEAATRQKGPFLIEAMI